LAFFIDDDLNQKVQWVALCLWLVGPRGFSSLCRERGCRKRGAGGNIWQFRALFLETSV
jgi:hypothetical protein